MRKKYSVLLMIFMHIIALYAGMSLKSCNETKIADNTRSKLINTTKWKNFPHKGNMNGYPYKECAGVSKNDPDLFYKLLFNKEGKYYVTNLAYSVKDTVFPYIKADPHYPMVGKPSTCIMDQFWKECFNIFKITSEWYSYIRFGFVYFKSEDVIKLTKKEYDEWMKNHPDTEIFKDILCH